MAMSPATLAAALQPDLETKLTAALGGTILDQPKLAAVCQAIADAVADKVIAHISTHAQLTFRPSDGAIQTAISLGAPTGPPAAPVLLVAGQIS